MAKANKKIVVSAKYLELIRRKGALLDDVFTGNGQANIDESMFKEHAKIERDWNKLDVPDFEDEPYEAPKHAAKKVG